MSRIPLSMPPGIYRNGTDYQSKGRYFDAALVRFFEGTIRPFGGWAKLSTSTLHGVGRSIITWKDNVATARAGIGTEQKLYAMSRIGTLYDITPVGFTPGRANAVAARGYGSGSYSVGKYGTARSDTTITRDASMWSLDTWGEHLVGVMADDAVIYEWALDTNTPAAAISGAPTARALLVTGDRILMALGAEGNPRRVKWCDQEDNTDWTPSATNQAGDFDLQTPGKLMLGKKVKGGNLLLTDQDAHLATYTADTLVYSFGGGPIATGCGAISQNCAGVIDNARCVWMSKNGFWIYDGYARPLPCDVSDYVFSNMDQDQVSKVSVKINSLFGEIKWFYQSAGSSEVDRYVLWNFRENHWNIGSLPRVAGVDRGPTTYPLAVGVDGYVYNHEIGFAYDGAEIYLEGGPIELGNGDYTYDVLGLIPDEKTQGQVSVSFRVKYEPEDSYASYGPYTLATRNDIRFNARNVNVRWTGVAAADWRVGVPRLVVEQASER